MSTNVEQNDGGFDLHKFLAAAARRRKSIAITVGVGLLLTLLLAFLIPPKYRSSATVLIEQQELPADLVRSTVTTYADQRVQIISQRVMTTQTLLDIVRRYDLYPGDRDKLAREELVDKMRDDIGLDMISADVIDPRSGMPREATIAFSVSYTSRSPAQASKVANELTTLYLNENLTSRARQAQDATTFLADEGDRLSKRIAELERRLAEFKAANAERLPELAQMNLQLLDRAERDLRDIETREMSLQQQKVFLEAQLAQVSPSSVLMTETGERIMGPHDRLKVLRSQLASTRALYSADHPDVVRIEREIAGLEVETGSVAADPNEIERQLKEARAELGVAREAYTADHPDIQRLERQLAALEATAGAPQTASRRPTSNPDNPAFIQLTTQLSATDNDLASLRSQRAQLRAQLGNLQRRISTSPQAEREYLELARDYENSQRKYQEIRAKQMEAATSQNLEADRKGERFTLIEPPLPPTRPVSPNRPLILVLGAILSIGAGLGMMYLRETLDATVRGGADMLALLGSAPLALVPAIRTAGEVIAYRRRAKLIMGSGAIALVAFVGAVHFLYRPLDVLWFVMQRRLGL
jgi:uncharacterized protein involved in exopolysaccharide biosynthesis